MSYVKPQPNDRRTERQQNLFKSIQYNSFVYGTLKNAKLTPIKI